jgi:hypothetical protein
MTSPRIGEDAVQDVLCWRPAGLGIAAAIVALLLVACSDAKPVSYYKGHADERAHKVQECLGRASDSQDCLNARQAEFEALPRNSWTLCARSSAWPL